MEVLALSVVFEVRLEEASLILAKLSWKREKEMQDQRTDPITETKLGRLSFCLSPSRHTWLIVLYLGQRHKDKRSPKG